MQPRLAWRCAISKTINMINLIPNTERKQMVRSFYHKLAVLFFIMCSISVFIFFVALLPSYFLSSVKNSAIDSKLDTQSSEPVPLPDQQTLSVIQDLDNKLGIVENSQNDKFIVSEKVINAIIVKKMPNIKITEISYENNPLKAQEGSAMGKKVVIKGVAPSREVLLLFRQALEDGANFKQVDLPVSNFIKGSNIQFHLGLILE
jgi:hypothetical protein